MAVAFIQEFTIVDGDLSTTNYDAVTKELGVTEAPDGLIVHTAGFDQSAGVFRIFDVWETKEHGERFMNEQLSPILERMMANASPDDFRPPTAETWYELHAAMS